jgi:DNA-binding response OmpR family regulator
MVSGHILLVDDEVGIVTALRPALRAVGHEVTVASDGTAALASFLLADPDVVLLDLGLPDMDGTEVARSIRATSAVPIIIVSARGDEMDRVLALELGADDYLTKPFGMRELLARIRAVTRRTAVVPEEPEAAVDLGPLEIDPRSRRVSLAGAELHLTPTEFDLLSYLAAEPGAVHRRSDILRDVWMTEWYGATKTLDAHVAAIRRKLGDPGWIESVRGVGFRFEVVRS